MSRAWIALAVVIAIGALARPSHAACWFNCVPSNAEAERLARAHLGSPTAGTAIIGAEFKLAQRSDVQLALSERKKIEPVLVGQGQCVGIWGSCAALHDLARHRLIEAVEWSSCPSAPDWYCAVPVFTKVASDAISQNTIRRDASTITVKTADVRFLKVVRTRGDGDRAEIHYEIEVVPNVFGTTIAPVKAERRERALVALRYSDGWRYVN